MDRITQIIQWVKEGKPLHPDDIKNLARGIEWLIDEYSKNLSDYYIHTPKEVIRERLINKMQQVL